MGVGIGVRSVGKRYGAVEVLRDVSLDLRAGSCTALIGEHGAGKSTLVGIISGKTAPSSGAVLVDGREVRFRSPRDARANGVATIPQELAYVSAVAALRPRNPDRRQLTRLDRRACCGQGRSQAMTAVSSNSSPKRSDWTIARAGQGSPTYSR
jgi:ribose transport system ATP-binding protein